MSDKAKLGLFICGVVLTGWIIGWRNIPGDWYANLQKPSFNPPNWVFSPVWTLLYILIAIVGWRVWVKAPDSDLRWLWLSQMMLNFAWSPVFFGQQSIARGLVVITLLCLNLVAFMLVSRRRDPLSFTLFAPYLAWVGFAMALNLQIWMLN